MADFMKPACDNFHELFSTYIHKFLVIQYNL